MPVTSRPYRNTDDLLRMQRLTQEINALNDGVGLLHVGDLPHRIFNILRRFDPGDVVRLWEDGQQQLLGWALLYPHFSSFDLQVKPGLHTDLEAAMLDWVERHLEEKIPKPEPDTEPPNTDVLDCDSARIALLERRGYTKTIPACYVLTIRSLNTPIPGPELPDGFVIRSAEGPHEAGKLGEVHSGGFGSDWTPDTYRRVMLSPGYDPQRELVVVAPDGRFAAFCILWFDAVNKTGLFEPVGAHPDFRRMGLTRALMRAGMRRMHSQGLETAIVLHEGDNPAAAGLYASIGFKPKQNIHRYTRQ